MIAERLDSEKILFGLKGPLVKALDGLCARSSVVDLAAHFRSQKPGENERYSYLGDGIAVPHVRIDHLAAPELILGLSNDGLSFNHHKINVVLLLATPAEQPPQHLQLLQRVCSLLPAIRNELLAQRDAAGCSDSLPEPSNNRLCRLTSISRKNRSASNSKPISAMVCPLPKRGAVLGTTDVMLYSAAAVNPGISSSCEICSASLRFFFGSPRCFVSSRVDLPQLGSPSLQLYSSMASLRFCRNTNRIAPWKCYSD